MVQKNPPTGCNFGALLPSPSENLLLKNQLSVLSIYIVVLDLINGRGTTANPIRGQHQKANSSLNIVALL